MSAGTSNGLLRSKPGLIVGGILALAVLGKIVGPPPEHTNAAPNASSGGSGGSSIGASQCATGGGTIGTVHVRVEPTKPDGRPWDAFGGRPDLAICIRASDGASRCYPSGSSNDGVHLAQCQDSLECSFGSVEIPQGVYMLTVIDVDAAENDEIAQSSCGVAGGEASFRHAQVTVEAGTPIPANAIAADSAGATTAARSLVMPNLPGYRVAETLANPLGVTVRYESTGIPMPPIAYAINYAPNAADGRTGGSHRITVHGHRGMREDSGGMSILAWRNGHWVFMLTTRSDQEPGELHVVDAFADGLAEYADQRSEISYYAPAPSTVPARLQ